MPESARSTEAAFQSAYSAYVEDLWIRRTKVLCLIAIGAIASGIPLDYFVYGDRGLFYPFLAIRLVTDILMAGLYVLLQTPSARKYHKALGFTWMALPVAHLTAMIGLADGVVSTYYIGNVLVVIGACLLMPWTFVECLAACLMTWFMYAAACSANWVANGPPSDTQIPQAFYNSFFTVVFSAVGLASSHVAEGFRQREFRLRFDLDQKKKELEGSYQKLAELDRAKTHFFANISHELRTPLTLILSPLDQLRSTPEIEAKPKVRDVLDIIYSNAMRLLALINDLLDLVRLDETKLALHLERVDLKELLPGLVDSMRGAAEKAQLNLETAFEETSSLLVSADKDQMEKVFINLLFNAIKFTHPGGLVRVAGRQENGTVIIEVHDTGIGIAEDKIDQVFSRFWQEDGSSTRTRQGTGIGLALVKELVELHHGTVSVQSRKGVGSTFTVRLPAGEGSIPQTGTEPQTDAWVADLFRRAQWYHEDPSLNEKPPAEAVSPKLDVRKHTLLLVEDEAAMQRFLVLELQGTYNVVVASDGQTGFELAQSHQPKLILTDMMLPKMDGITLCKKLKASPTLLPARIVLLTARADDRTKLAALEAGADDFLVKPFSTVELKTRLANLLLTAQLERELHSQNQVLESTLKQLRAAEAQLIQTERLSALGNLSAGIMHEINNPINFMLTAVHFLKSSLPDASEDAKDTVGDIEGGLKRIRDIIADLKGFAYGGASITVAECDPEKIMRTARRLLAHEVTHEIEFEESIVKGTKFVGNENQLVQLIVNLVQNALHATSANPAKNRPRRIRVRMEPAGDHFLLAVWDNGIGIPPENLPKLFDPFFTTKPVGEGMGLGLSICHTIVKQHHGQISVASSLDAYTEFTVKLPLDQSRES
ncbi:MAG: response regulator [Verrucomicrobia bacterium]|nr:response regulator [Verrucomicrobiota bacterium]